MPVFDDSLEQLMILEIAALIVAFGTIAAVAVWTVVTGSPPTPTSMRVRRAMLAILPPRLPLADRGRIYELGSGWGGLSRALADRFPGQPVVGIELSPLSLALPGNHALSALTPLLSKPATSSRGDSIHLCPFFGSPQRLHL